VTKGKQKKPAAGAKSRQAAASHLLDGEKISFDPMAPSTKAARGRTIVVVDKPAQRLFVGQPVFVIVESAGARWGRIQSLRVDDADLQEVPANASAPNGVGVGLVPDHRRVEGLVTGDHSGRRRTGRVSGATSSLMERATPDCRWM